jgi:hypothetical protein
MDDARSLELTALRDKRLEVWRTLKDTLDSFQTRVGTIDSYEVSTYQNMHEYLGYLDKQILMLHSIPSHTMGPAYTNTYASDLVDTDPVPSGINPPLCADPAWNAMYFGGGGTRISGPNRTVWQPKAPPFVYTGPVPSGGPVEDGPHVRYRKLVAERERMIFAFCSDIKHGRPEQPGLSDAITQADKEIEQLCEQLGYEYLQWTCQWSEYADPEIRYQPPPPKPREIVDKLFTEITGLNPEDTYDGWREAFMKTGLVSALEHMKEHVR